MLGLVLLAWRNLWRHKRRTWLTVSAMAFSNVLLIFMISIQFSTYELMIKNSLAAFSSHIQLQFPGFNKDQRMHDALSNGDQLSLALQQRFPELSISERSIAFVVAGSKQRSIGMSVSGVRYQAERKLSTISKNMVDGVYLSGKANEIVIGKALANTLKLKVGDELTLLGSTWDSSFAAGVAVVSGIFNTGVVEVDRSVSQINMADFNTWFDMQGKVHSIVVNVSDLGQVAAYRAEIESFVEQQSELTGNRSIEVLDWQALHPQIQQSIDADLISAWFMYAVLIALVTFSVLNTQLMSVLERTREFGIMMALGCKNSLLFILVLLEAAFLNVLGLLIGLLCGFSIVLYFHFFGLNLAGMADAAVLYNIPTTLYPKLSWKALSIGPLTMFVACLIGALYPALRMLAMNALAAMSSQQ